MAELTNASMVNESIAGQKPGTQLLELVVWPDREPAKITKEKSKETGRTVDVEVARIPLCRALGNVADFRGWRLSAWWEDFRFSTCHKWRFVPDVEERAAGDEEAGHVQAEVEVYGNINTKPGQVKADWSKQSVTWDDIPYKWNDTKGFFCYDANKKVIHPLNIGSVMRLREAFLNQRDNPDTSGTRDDRSKPKILWTPWMLHGSKAEMKMSEEFEANFEIFKSWAEVEADAEKGIAAKPGKKVHWELQKVRQ